MPSSSNAVFYENGFFLDYFGNTIIDFNNFLVSGATGPEGPTGPAGSSSSSTILTTNKFVKEFFTTADGDALIITRAELIAALPTLDAGYIIPAGYGVPATTNIPTKADMIIQVWFLLSSGVWELYNIGNVGPGGIAGNITTYINDTTGDISVTLAFAPFVIPLRARVVIII